MLLGFFENPVVVIIFILALLLALSVHEAAHAWTAAYFGDDTAKSMGRTSLNPLVHLDPVGTILLLLFGFGWGKPVPVDERNLKNKTHSILVALAGPASNLLTAIICGFLFRLIPVASTQVVLSIFIILNIRLMLFNLIPIPPLDGSKVLRLFVPDNVYFMLEQYGLILILAIFFLVRGGLGDWLITSSNWLYQIITGAPSLL